MAAEKDVGEWLRNKLGDDAAWSASNISSALTPDLLTSIAASFHLFFVPVCCAIGADCKILNKLPRRFRQKEKVI